MKKIFAIGLATIVLAGCSDSITALKALDDLGFKDAKTTGFRAFMCGRDYSYSTGFEATNANGKHVTGAVCSGWFTGSAVKFD